MSMNIFRKEHADNLLLEDKHFERSLTAKDLIALGIGAVIGTGIFILPGTVAATEAGPGDFPLLLDCGRRLYFVCHVLR